MFPTALPLLLLLTALLPAQELTLHNLAPLPRAEWWSCVVPFAEGSVRAAPERHVPGSATVWQPFGARWPDGSWRQALCLFRAEVPALGERTLTLQEGPGPQPEGDFGLPPHTYEFQWRHGEKSSRAPARLAGILEDNAARRVVLLHTRIPDTPLLAEVIVTGCRDQEHAQVDLAVFCSDPRTSAMQCDLDELAVECRGMALLLRHPGLFAMRQTTTPEGSRVVLLQKTTLADGQGIRRSGAVVPPLRQDRSLRDQTLQAAVVAPPLAATTWTGSSAFGAFGLVPEPPPWLQGARLRSALAERHRAFAARDRSGAGDPFWCGPFGLERFAGQTGDQQDFGVVKLSAVAHSGNPSLLLEAWASVQQEACRPVHFFEADGKPVQARDHPEWVVWSGRTHWHAGVSKDRLGKPVPEPALRSHGWTGKDREHWSSNALGAFALLTGSHWARRELQNEVQLHLAGETVDPGLSTSGSGAPRGAGRTLLAACWAYLATGDEALAERTRARIDQVLWVQWAGRELGEDQVRTMAVQGPDDRMLGGKLRYWTPWQDAIAAVGLAAAHRVFGSERAREMAEALAITVVRHGWLLTDRECLPATAIRWQDGAPLSPEQLADPAAVLWSHGTAFDQWSIGAVTIASAAAERRGDEALRGRADEILRRVRAGRQRPDDGFMDRLTEWDAVRW